MLGLGAGSAMTSAYSQPPEHTSSLSWRRLPDLPLALAGQFARVYNTGGSHFPVSKWPGGTKVWMGRKALLLIGGGDAANNRADGLWILAPREAELGDQHSGFSRSFKVFHPGKRSWQILDRLAFRLVTAARAIWNGLVVVPGGKDRPARRSSAVHAVAQREIIINLAGAAL